jgi:hypothetical protein
MDISGLLKSLNARRVRYVVIGASAFPTHGYARMTAYDDILIAPSDLNARRTLKGLADAGYDVTDLKPGELLRKKILLRQYILATYTHPSRGFGLPRIGATAFETKLKASLSSSPVSRI